MPNPMTEFTLLFRGRGNFDTPERARENAQNWQTWFKQLGACGHFRDGHRTPLESAVKVVGGREMVSEGPCAEAKEVVSGYALIEATDIAEAVELSKECPILDVGGSVEVRPVQKFKR